MYVTEIYPIQKYCKLVAYIEDLYRFVPSSIEIVHLQVKYT